MLRYLSLILLIAFAFYVQENKANAIKDKNRIQPVVNRALLNDTLYAFIETELPWYEAMIYCQKELRMNLAALQTAEEHQIVADYIASQPFSTYFFWLGGMRPAYSSQWTWWPTREPFTYRFWEKYYPDLEWEQQGCAYITFSGVWADSGCRAEWSFICEEIK